MVTPGAEVLDNPDAPVSVPSRSGPGIGALWSPSVVVVAVYLALGVIAYWRVVLAGGAQLFGTTSDSLLATWFLAWVPHALAHGTNPYFSNAMFAPAGINLAQNTEGSLLGLLTVPLAAVAGPVVRANVMMVLAMPVSASAAFYVLRRWGVWMAAAGVGGLLYGFSPYMVGQGLGHLVLVFAPWPPLIALVVVEIVNRRRSRVRLGFQLGLLVVAQFLTEPEVLTMVAIVVAVGILWVLAFHPAGTREVARRLLVPVGIGGAVAGVLLAYPLWMIVAGPQHYTGPAQGVSNPYTNDVLSFVVPGPLQQASFGLSGIAERLVAGNVFESGGFIGVPLVVSVGILAWLSRRRGRTQVAVWCLVASAVLSLGPYLSVDGHRTTIPLPFLVLTRVPLVNNLLAVRFSLITSACVAAVVAFGLDDLRNRSGLVKGMARQGPSRMRRRASERNLRSALTALSVILSGVVVTQFPHWPYASQPVSVLPVAVSRAVERGDPVTLTYPYAQQFAASALSWQFAAGFDFRLLGGYGEHPERLKGFYVFPARMHPGDLQRFLANQEGFVFYGPAPSNGPGLVRSTRETVGIYHVGLVIVDTTAAGSAAVVRLMTAAFGAPRLHSGNFLVWTPAPGAA